MLLKATETKASAYFYVFTKKIHKNFISAQYTTIVYSCMFLGLCLWFLDYNF